MYARSPTRVKRSVRPGQAGVSRRSYHSRCRTHRPARSKLQTKIPSNSTTPPASSRNDTRQCATPRSPDPAIRSPPPRPHERGAPAGLLAEGAVGVHRVHGEQRRHLDGIVRGPRGEVPPEPPPERVEVHAPHRRLLPRWPRPERSSSASRTSARGAGPT